MVQEVSQDMIFDLNDLKAKTTLNYEKDELNEKITWNKIKVIRITSNLPDRVSFKYTYNTDEPFKTINLLEKGRKKIKSETKSYTLKNLYTNPLPLTKKKYDHLQFLCNKCVIPKTYHAFVRNLPFSANAANDSDTD